MTPEGKVKAMVSRALTKLAHCYKFMPVQNGMGAPGLDYYCCIGGLFVAIETKAPGKHPTPRQITTILNVREAGGMAFVIHDQDEIDQMLAQIALRIEFATPKPVTTAAMVTELNRRTQSDDVIHDPPTMT